MNKLISIILAGGRGERMGLLSQSRAKPILYFGGKFRVIDFSLSNCFHSKIDNCAVLTDYDHAGINSYLVNWRQNSKFDLDILGPRMGSYLATANAVYQNLNYIQNHKAEKVIILSGDHIYKMDYRSMLTFHDSVNADLTVATVKVPIEQASRFGTVVTDKQNRIIEFKEKSPQPNSLLVSMGVYTFNADVLAEMLEKDAADRNSTHDFGYDILPKMIERNRVFAYRFKGYWRDIGTIGAYYEANMDLLKEKPPMSLDGNWPIFTVPPNVKRHDRSSGGKLMASIVSDEANIKGHVENSILSPGVYIDEHAVVKNSVIMPNVYVGNHSVVDHCILDERVYIDKFCYIGFGAKNGNLKKCMVLGRNIRIPSNTAISHEGKYSKNFASTNFDLATLPWGVAISNPLPLNINLSDRELHSVTC